MSLADQIVADVTGVFLVTSDFAKTVTHYPAGNEFISEAVVAVFHEDFLDEPGEDGGGIMLTNERGIRIREGGKLSISADVIVTGESSNGKASVWLIGGDKWVTKRVEGRDDGMQTVHVVRVDQKATRRTQKV